MTPNDLDPVVLQQRYSLLCRALQATPAADDPQPALDTVSRLDELIHRELLELARLGSPDDFAEIYLGFTRELDRFREFCADPRLAEKTVVAFGGPFSAGKSSLINALIGKKLLVVEVDPTTALPAYVLAGQVDAVHALNLHHLRISLTDDELASLTHDETQRYGSQVARALSAAFITRCDFPWANLAFIDTPGYSGRATAGDRTDADIAAAQLSGAHAFVWVASIKQGNLSEEDLAFLARIDPDIPRIVVASHADQVTESDRAAVIERMKETLAARNLPVLGVYAVSARPRQAELLAPLRAQLDTWNQTPRHQRFAHRFRDLFTRYQRGLGQDIRDAYWQLQRINRMATLADGNPRSDAGELKSVIDERLAALKRVESSLFELRGRFFGELKRTGDAVGIPLPEPDEVDLLTPNSSNLLAQLIVLREIKYQPEPDFRQHLLLLRSDINAVDISTYPLRRELMPERLPRSPKLRQCFALLLVAALASQPAISKNQTWLLCQLLDSLDLGESRANLFKQARELSPETLRDAAECIDKFALWRVLLLDILVLLSLDCALSNEASRLVSELIELFLSYMNGIRPLKSDSVGGWVKGVVGEASRIRLFIFGNSSDRLSVAMDCNFIRDQFWKWITLHSISEVAEEIHEMAKQGNPVAQYRMGTIYHDGGCVPKNINTAINWLRKAVEKEHRPALNYLVGMAIDGIPEAQFCLGEIFEEGVGFGKDTTKSIRYYEEAEKNGHVSAKYRLETVKYRLETEKSIQKMREERDELMRQHTLRRYTRS